MPPSRGSSRGTPSRGARPGNRRPASRAGAARGRAEQAAPARPRFTNRAVILLVVFAVLVVSYASSMRAYLQQRAHISELNAQIAESRDDIAAAQREMRRWKDPAYVQAQARERFGWVFPGEVSYQVLDRNGLPLQSGDDLTDPASIAQEPEEAWWVGAYETVQSADHPEKNDRPPPATRIEPPPAPKAD